MTVSNVAYVPDFKFISVAYFLAKQRDLTPKVKKTVT